jgi:hypothetical protein
MVRIYRSVSALIAVAVAVAAPGQAAQAQGPYPIAGLSDDARGHSDNLNDPLGPAGSFLVASCIPR